MKIPETENPEKETSETMMTASSAAEVVAADAASLAEKRSNDATTLDERQQVESTESIANITREPEAAADTTLSSSNTIDDSAGRT